MVAHGPALSPRFQTAWDSLETDGPPSVTWIRPVPGPRVVVLLGAFDPPTRAHVCLASGASRCEGAPAVLCLTKLLLGRPDDELIPPVARIELLDAIASRRGYGVAIANRGTYLEVQRALANGLETTFVIGSDKLSQLEDPSFYEDGAVGVRSTFEEVRFIVVPRGRVEVGRDDVRVLDADEVFGGADVAAISSTEVRRRIRSGADIDALVPPEVALDLAGYTSAK
jgi:nicotinic acid mononucleotide adenylyltransferase